MQRYWRIHAKICCKILVTIFCKWRSFKVFLGVQIPVLKDRCYSVKIFFDSTCTSMFFSKGLSCTVHDVSFNAILIASQRLFIIDLILSLPIGRLSLRTPMWILECLPWDVLIRLTLLFFFGCDQYVIIKYIFIFYIDGNWISLAEEVGLRVYDCFLEGIEHIIKIKIIIIIIIIIINFVLRG